MQLPRRLPLATLLLLLLLPSAQGRLLPCPECTNSVSTLARFCPRCGCVIEEILKAEATKTRAEEEARPLWKNAVVEFRSDRAVWPGVVVDMPDGRYVLSPLAPMETVESLTIVSRVSSNNVPYATIELAENADLVRLATPATNLTSLVLAAGAAPEAASWQVEPNWSGVSTNLVSVSSLRGTGEPVAAQALAGWNWIAVKPLEFRTQTRLLRDARLAKRPDTVLRTRLKNTVWLTPHLQKEGLREAERLDTRAP